MESQEILNYVKQKTLKNYFPSDRNFLKLFPEENFNFNGLNYNQFLYFGKEEAIAYLKDFLLFIKLNYNTEVFSYNNYFSIFDEFKKYLEKNNVFLYVKTKMGLNIANNEPQLLLNTLQKEFGETHFLGDEKKIAFSSTLPLKENYNYEFFNWLTDKTKDYNNYKFIVEPLIDTDIETIKNFFKGIKFPGDAPFFLNNTHQNWKEIKTLILNELVASTPDKAFVIGKEKVVALVIAKIEKSTCNLTILCENDYYDSDLSYPIDFICDLLFEEYEISKISSVNLNKGIAFSGINSALAMAHFKPDYSLQGEYNGYSKIKYDLSRSDNKESASFVEKSIIKFIF